MRSPLTPAPADPTRRTFLLVSASAAGAINFYGAPGIRAKPTDPDARPPVVHYFMDRLHLNVSGVQDGGLQARRGPVHRFDEIDLYKHFYAI